MKVTNGYVNPPPGIPPTPGDPIDAASVTASGDWATVAFTRRGEPMAVVVLSKEDAMNLADALDVATGLKGGKDAEEEGRERGA